MLKQTIDNLRLKIEALLREYPDLANDEFLRADMLEGETNMDELLTEIYDVIADTTGKRDGTQKRLDDLMARRQRFQARVDFCRDLISSIMLSADLKKKELPEVTISMRRGQPKLLGDCSDASLLPNDVCRITRVPDKTKIREALENGRVIPGFVLGNPQPSLMLKVK